MVAASCSTEFRPQNQPNHVVVISCKGFSALDRDEVKLLKRSNKRVMRMIGKSEEAINSIPIVLIHRGDSPYLLYSLAQAKYTNPNSKVYLIGDDYNNCYSFVEHHKFKLYFQEAEEFGKVYRHFSINGYSYELFCFQRWFILSNFMSSNNLERCVYIDSDVMLYADMTKEQKKFHNFEFTLFNSKNHDVCSPNLIFVNRKEALAKFCNFITQSYKDSSFLQELAKRYCGLSQRRKENISDMFLFWEYRRLNNNIIGETNTIINGAIYDLNIKGTISGFEISNGIKKIEWIENLPFCKCLDSGKKIRFCSLHFQGSNKKLMKYYFTGGKLMSNYFLIQKNFQKLSKKLKQWFRLSSEVI